MATSKRSGPVIARGEQVSGVLFPGTRRALLQAELRRTLSPIIARWVKAACLWDEHAAIGDHRFVVFSIDIAPKVQVYVQLWSEPDAPVLWEVSSGKSNPTAEKWLGGERARRIEALGFEIGGEVENYQREVEIETPADADRIARKVVDIFYQCFDYRGRQAVDGFMAFESRAEPALTYDSFSPEDLLVMLEAAGFTAEMVDDSDETPVIQAVRRGIQTRVVCAERLEDDDLFQTVVFTSDVEVSPEVADEVRAAAAPLEQAAGQPIMTMGTTLMFSGGVTVQWVMDRLGEWDAMTWEARKTAKKGNSGKPQGGETLH